MYVEQVMPNISGIHVSSSNSASGGICNMHLHEEAELIAVKSGCYVFMIDNKNQAVMPGDVIMVNRNVPHGTSIEKNTHSTMCQVNIEKYLFDEGTELGHLQAFLNENKYPYYVFKKGKPLTDEINSIIDGIEKEYSENKVANDIFIKSYIYKLTAILYRNGIIDDYFSKINKTKLTRLMPVLLYIDENYKSSVTLEELGNVMHLNHEYLSRMFKEITGRNIFEYVNFVRISNSMTLLVKTDMTVLEVAYESGYPSISYFNRSFLKFCGCTPTVYRKIKKSEVN